ncbi:MAG: FCD domain-containing protein [Shewanella sp.]
MIETDLLAKAIPRRQEADLEKVERVLEQLESTFKHEEAVASWSELNTQFHTCLYQAANRHTPLRLFTASILIVIHRYIRLQLLLAGGIPVAEHEHRALLNHCKQRETEKATALLRHHILHAAMTIRDLVAKPVV